MMSFSWVLRCAKWFCYLIQEAFLQLCVSHNYLISLSIYDCLPHDNSSYHNRFTVNGKRGYIEPLTGSCEGQNRHVGMCQWDDCSHATFKTFSTWSKANKDPITLIFRIKKLISNTFIWIIQFMLTTILQKGKIQNFFTPNILYRLYILSINILPSYIQYFNKPVATSFGQNLIIIIWSKSKWGPITFSVFCIEV